MIDDRDMFAAANAMIGRLGEDARVEAAMRADERLGAGDLDSQALWMRLLKAIDELQGKGRPADAPVH